MEQNLFEPEIEAHLELDEDVRLKHASIPTTVSEDETGCFECNICLDSAHDPVVTLCGHLYCWPCIYKWLQVQSSFDEPEQKNCPVCKAVISPASLVPLYGRGISSSDSKPKRPRLDLVVPPRPSPVTTSASHPSEQFHPPSQSIQQQYFPHSAENVPSSYLGGAIMTSLFNPTIGMFGDVVFPRVFGSSGANLFSHPHQNSYLQTGISNPRMRRQDIQLDKSLYRVSIFLFCCFILCLLLF